MAVVVTPQGRVQLVPPMPRQACGAGTSHTAPAIRATPLLSAIGDGRGSRLPALAMLAPKLFMSCSMPTLPARATAFGCPACFEAGVRPKGGCATRC
eukprot:7379547-Prymnesium_polylepis.3